jgi:Chitobiase/beta-hexosaminidase C-terminal domain
VTVSLSATDSGGSGLDQTVYTTDGSDPASAGITYTGPFTVAQTATVRFFSTTTAPYQLSWNTRKVSLGQHTLTAIATDAAGNATTSAGVLVTVTK